MQIYGYVSNAIILTNVVVWALVSGIRASVMCSGLVQKWVAAASVFGLYMVTLAINIYAYAIPGGPSTEFLNNLSPGVIASRVALIAASIIVVCMTWHAMYEQRRLFRQAVQDRGRISYADILLQHGTHILRQLRQLIVMVPLDVAHMLFTLFSLLSDWPGYNVSGITMFTNPITAILITRFLIHLQEVDGAGRSLVGSCPQAIFDLRYSPETQGGPLEAVITPSNI
ncbi:hypothetical protein BD311DRAFT_748012 [Dichomitus squalens]|uniref:Uncharacterized protein n=1 Tax=Dichomitus squalens TaxID=114155 RepID=A0A4Q9N054_9APHY|nr:hypothetical protein BD311DRAFT_748012 [Dichomitus squalens]